MFRDSYRGAALIVPFVAAAVALVGCSSSSGHPTSPSSDSSAATSPASSTSAVPSTSTTGDVPVVGKSGATVTGAFGATPHVTIPATAAPKALTEQTLIAGKGTKVAAGDILVANYVGETWASKPTVFDSSFSRGEPAGFVIGEGQVIPGWDKTLVGKRLGSRMLLTIPPADGYGSSGNSQAGISGTDTLVFVIDLTKTYEPNASAPGTIDSQVPATGWPKVTNTPAKPPTITSVAGVKAPTAPISKLLVKGAGAKIDSSKTLVLQLVETDIATGKQTQSTWGQAPQVDSASSVLPAAAALTGQSVGARVIALLPATPAVPATSTSAAVPAATAQVVIIDVVGQF